MSPVHRPLDGDVLLFDLEQERDRLADQPSGRQARTLLKSGPLRVILIALGPGGTTAEHQAEGPITVQPLRGQIRFTAGARVHELGPGYEGRDDGARQPAPKGITRMTTTTLETQGCSCGCNCACGPACPCADASRTCGCGCE